MNLDPDYAVDEHTRANIARELSLYYRELSGTEKPRPRFSVARYLRGLTIRREGVTGYEREVLEAAATANAQMLDVHRAQVPWGVFGRTMTTTPGQKGGYAVGAVATDVADVLKPWSVVADAGVQVLAGLRDSVVIPRVKTAASAAWYEEAGTATDSTPTLGNVSLSPKTGACYIKFSMQLLRQGEAVESFIRAHLLRAIGTLVDTAFFSGAGGTAPLGLLNTDGIGTQSGTDLAHAGLLAMRQAALTAGAREDALQWVGPPAMQTLLGARDRITNGGRFLWDAGRVLDSPAHATPTAPATTLIVGDFNQAVVGVWGAGVQIDVDPSQDFNTAGLVARVLLHFDVGFPRPEAFTVATSIT